MLSKREAMQVAKEEREQMGMARSVMNEWHPCDCDKRIGEGCPVCRPKEDEVGKKLDEALRTDPWKHRSAGMLCATCMWYVPKERKGDADSIGRCRRHAPTMNGYPVVFPTDWCGDHKLA